MVRDLHRAVTDKAKYYDQETVVLKVGSCCFQVYRNFANLFTKLSVSTFYKLISKFQQKSAELKELD